MSKDIVILIDSREKIPWGFEIEDKVKSGYKTRVAGSEVVTLDAADYTLAGYEDLIRIERKASFSELFCNMTPVANRDRFEREMQKLSDIKHKYLLIESSPTRDLLGMSIPQFYKSPPCSVIVKWLESLEDLYNIKIRYVNDCGVKYARMLFEQCVKKYG